MVRFLPELAKFWDTEHCHEILSTPTVNAVVERDLKPVDGAAAARTAQYMRASWSRWAMTDAVYLDQTQLKNPDGLMDALQLGQATVRVPDLPRVDLPRVGVLPWSSPSRGLQRPCEQRLLQYPDYHGTRLLDSLL